jgi:Ulp1 family protease
VDRNDEEWLPVDVDIEVDTPLKGPSYPCPSAVPGATTVTDASHLSSITSSQKHKIQPLQSQGKKRVDNLFSRTDLSTVVTQPNTTRVTVESIQTLKPGRWLGDEVINAYMAILTNNELTWYTGDKAPRTSMCYSTFFYTKLANLSDRNPQARGYSYQQVKEWGTNLSVDKDIFRLETLFIPVHDNNNHWTAIHINFPNKTITYYDSLGNPGWNHLTRIHRYLQDEHDNTYGTPLPPGWTTTPTPESTPLQTNGYDCGVFPRTHCSEYRIKLVDHDLTAQHRMSRRMDAPQCACDQ